MKISENKLIVWIIILLPLVDIINGFMLKVANMSGFGIIMHTLFLLIMIKKISYKKAQKNTIYIIFLIVYLSIQTLITNCFYNLSPHDNFSYIIKYIYFFITLETLIYFKNNNTLWKYIKKSYTWLYPLGSILPRLMGYSFSSYGSGEGALGFMYSQNSYTFVMIVSLYWSLEILFKKVNLLNIIRTILCLVSLLLIGSKSGYIFTGLVIAYLVFNNIKKHGAYNTPRVTFVILSVLIIILIIFRLYSAELNLIYTRILYFLNYYGHSSFDAILNFLTSDRWNRIDRYFTSFSDNIFSIVFGLGYGYFENTVTTEMDIFNLIYIFGILGTIIYIITFIKVTKIHKYKNSYKTLLIFLTTYLFFGGHVLADVMANNILAIVIIMGQQMAYPLVTEKGRKQIT